MAAHVQLLALLRDGASIYAGAVQVLQLPGERGVAALAVGRQGSNYCGGLTGGKYFVKYCTTL